MDRQIDSRKGKRLLHMDQYKFQILYQSKSALVFYCLKKIRVVSMIVKLHCFILQNVKGKYQKLKCFWDSFICEPALSGSHLENCCKHVNGNIWMWLNLESFKKYACCSGYILLSGYMRIERLIFPCDLVEKICKGRILILIRILILKDDSCKITVS